MKVSFVLTAGTEKNNRIAKKTDSQNLSFWHKTVEIWENLCYNDKDLEKER